MWFGGTDAYARFTDHVFTIAGTGHQGDHRAQLATQSQLRNPSGVVSLPDGGFLVADTGNNRILRVTRRGKAKRFAGTGAAGHTGDGGRATDAELNRPGAIVVEADGGVLIADTGNNAIREVQPNGIIRKVAGTYPPPPGEQLQPLPGNGDDGLRSI